MRHILTGVWLNGRLSGMADPKTYPTLNEILGDEAEPDAEPEPGSEHAGAKLWLMYLNREK